MGIYAKFSQNLDLGRLLLATGNRQLYEATGDMEYGCGIGLKSSKWETKDWDGVNTCGNLLMKVREELVGKIDMGDMSIDLVTTEGSVNDESEMETTLQMDTSHPPEVAKNDASDNTLVQIASQTLSLSNSLPVTEEEKRDEYTANFPYLEKAKSPPAPSARDPKPPRNSGRVSGNTNANTDQNANSNSNNKNSYNRIYKKAKQSRADSLRSVPATTTPGLGNGSEGPLSSRVPSTGNNRLTHTNRASTQVNEDEFTEILKKRKSYDRAQTSTPTTGYKSKQKALEMKLNQQNKGLRKLGLEPSSNFVKNIMDNHSF